jgi:hypothetical protein
MVTNAARGAVLEAPPSVRGGIKVPSEEATVAIDAITHSPRERYRPAAGVSS